MVKLDRYSVGLYCLALVGAWAGPAHAQNVGADEIVVTAQKREQAIQDVPIAINAFSEEDIETRGIENVEDLSFQVPGLTFGEVAGSGQINLRGVGFGIVSGAGENSVAVHVDGVYIANPGAAIMLQDDLGGIEVLRGPQGTLYGRNATGGVINFQSQQPSDAFEAEGVLGIANNESWGAGALVSGPLSDTVRGRISLNYDDRGGYVENLALGGDEGGQERLSGRAAVDIDFTSSFSADLSVFAGQETLGAPFNDPIDNTYLAQGVAPGQVALDPFEIRTNVPSVSEKDLVVGIARLSWDLSDTVRLVSLTGVVNYAIDINYDGDGTAANLFGIERSISDETISQEFNLTGQAGGLNWLMGAYYLQQTVEIDSIANAPGLNPLGLNRVDNFTEEDIESYSIFADATLALTETFDVFGGVRYLTEDRDFVQSQTLAFDVGLFAPPFAPIGVFADVPACSALRLTTSDNHLTGRLGVQMDVSDDGMVYGQFSTGYKSGGFASSSCNDPFEPETVDAFEVGLKTPIFSSSTFLTAAVFHYDYSDLQVEEVIAPNIFVNNADAEIFGAEMDLQARLSDTLAVNAGVVLLQTEYTRFTNLDAFNPLAGVQDLSGNPLLRSPEWRLNLGVENVFPLQDERRLVLRADLVATDSYQLREFNAAADEQEGYVTGNASLAFETGSGLTVRGWVKNIADTDILGGVINAGTIAPSRIGSYGPGRTFGLELAIRH